MQNTITDRFNKEQARIAQRRVEAAAGYPKLFAGMAAEWNSPASPDCAWLMYAANYVFRTGGILWAMDPLTLRWRVPEAPAVDSRQAFDRLDFVLLTHRHADHLDFDLLRSLRHLPIRWVVPEYLLPEVMAEAALPENQITVPNLLQPFEIKGIHILPFEGRHWEAGLGFKPQANNGVPAMGYLVQFNGKSWLFPGDTRDYHAPLAIDPGTVDGLFAHLWLGRRCALLDEPPLLEDFCRFCLNPRPKRVILTHLEEFGRKAENYWDIRHAQMVIKRLEQIAPQLPVSAVRMGEYVIL